MQPSNRRRKLLQEAVQDHDRGPKGEVSHGYWCQGETKYTRILTLKTPVKLDSTKQALLISRLISIHNRAPMSRALSGPTTLRLQIPVNDFE